MTSGLSAAKAGAARSSMDNAVATRNLITPSRRSGESRSPWIPAYTRVGTQKNALGASVSWWFYFSVTERTRHEDRYFSAYFPQGLFRQDGRSDSEPGHDPALDSHPGAVRSRGAAAHDGAMARLSADIDPLHAGHRVCRAGRKITGAGAAGQ